LVDAMIRVEAIFWAILLQKSAVTDGCRSAIREGRPALIRRP